MIGGFNPWWNAFGCPFREAVVDRSESRAE
jgi:hypothetical protein